jgi:hypothetical protein
VATPDHPDENGCDCANGGFGKLAGLQIRISEKGLDLIQQHLARPIFHPAAENDMMMARLRAALQEGRPVDGADASFYMHETYEATLMGRGVAYDEAHAAAFARYGVSPYSVYAKEVIEATPQAGWNDGWRDFWRNC